ncbi:MAG TPA: MMPL family transporter [Candidatus Avipropionibacterium avicola]|uniref:MMPL family transporter n=1 Tax=Candidatus Avipropionibacterium avicola TaxID=2840701 RepID=A0A9D1H0U6_9ACTN|nr:MMPL family transporter [Candidatus Avipropionibacterium avicola]
MRRGAVSESLTSRRGARIWLVLGVVVLVGLMGLLRGVSLDTGTDSAPADSESSRVTELLEKFPGADEGTLLVVASRPDGAALDPNDLSELEPLVPALEEATDGRALGPFPSEDGEAAVVQVTLTVGDDAEHAVELVREVTASQAGDLTLQVTGGPAFGVDVAASFDGADFTLLIVTIAIVAVLLIVTYRSPVLWLVPLAVVGIADQVANKVTAGLGNLWDLQFDTGIVSVLVFGAGTNYALLLVSRYREELHHQTDHRAALATAWRRTVPAIVASNLTVVVSLLTLVLAVIPGTHGLGVSSAVGLLIALAAVLLVLPPALAICGPRVFWPFVPRPDAARHGRVWRRVATGVVRRPWVPLITGVALLGVMAAGLVGTTVGLSQVEKFRVPSESAAGLETLADHFPPGQAQPLTVVAEAEHADEVADALDSVPGVVRVSQPTESNDQEWVKFSVTGEPAPGTQESHQLVVDLRAAADAVPGEVLVGGQSAVDVDARDGNTRDLLLIAPLVLLVTLVVLVLLVRAAVAPVVLLVVNLASATAAIGAGSWLSRTVFGWDALDLQVPLLSFLFLVALGVDYTIFLVHRAQSEAARVGTRAGMVNALASTGAVITSAGVVLAGVFAALGLLPLVTLGQIGLTVCLGVLVDTLVVRSLVVPALFSLLGDRMWWPRRIGSARPTPPEGEESDHDVPSRVPVAG